MQKFAKITICHILSIRRQMRDKRRVLLKSLFSFGHSSVIFHPDHPDHISAPVMVHFHLTITIPLIIDHSRQSDIMIIITAVCLLNHQLINFKSTMIKTKYCLEPPLNESIYGLLIVCFQIDKTEVVEMMVEMIKIMAKMSTKMIPLMRKRTKHSTGIPLQ